MPVVSEDQIPAVEPVETGGKPTDSRLATMVMNTRDLPAMPNVASKVLELSSDPGTSAQQLQQVIADDQALTARILKIANSAMYASSRKIRTLTEAIVLLGFNSIRSLVVTSAARNLYDTKRSRMGLKERLLWEHSMGCAFACRLLAKKKAPALAEEAFLAGLLHDIGKLVLNIQVPEHFDEIVQIVYNENRSFHDTEVEMLGFSHAEVGALLTGKWKLSTALEEAIRNHHTVDVLDSDSPLLNYLCLGNEMCKKYGIGFVERPSFELEDCAVNRRRGFTAEELTHVAGTLQQTLETEMEIFI